MSNEAGHDGDNNNKQKDVNLNVNNVKLINFSATKFQCE